MNTFPKLKQFISGIDSTSISAERKKILTPLILYIQANRESQSPIRLNFICTHNSRRSHLAQVWAQTMAFHFGIKNVFCYSGGTEATALYPMIIQTLNNVGFEINTIAQVENTVYSIKYTDNEAPIIGFSKTLENEFNPKSDFCAIMTCDSANETCPFIAGATERIPITFEDPKAFDNSPQQAEKYKERNLQIATEMFYVFSKIAL